jgi:uncharacterized protein (TIGR02145 family)
MSSKQIIITAPTRIAAENLGGKVTLLVSDDGDHTVTRALRLEGIITPTPTYAASTHIWIIEDYGVRQIWSDAIAMPACNKDTYDGLGYSGPKADCRTSNSTYSGHLYSWPYVHENATSLCPPPWRVPSRDDFINLDKGLGGTGEDGQWVLGSGRFNGNAWGGAYTGFADPNGVIHSQGSVGNYWSSTENDADTSFYLNYNNSYSRPQSNYGQWAGYPVRCVREDE